jgi:hypothetical protein
MSANPFPFERAPGDGQCVSDFAFDKLVRGLLTAEQRERARQHVASCVKCRRRLEAIEAAKAAFAGRAVPVAAAHAASNRGSLTRLHVASVAVGALAAAAALLLVARRPDAGPGQRIKGTGESFGFAIVRPDGSAAGDELTGAARPGDRLQWRFELRQTRYVAVLSRDGAGRASTYFPSGERAAAIQPNATVPIATELDAVLGSESVYGIMCSTPIELAPLRKELELKGTLQVPKECDVERYSFTKSDRR